MSHNTKCEPNTICHPLLKRHQINVIDLQCQLLSDFASRFQSSMIMFHENNVWM